jgi:hypothetical protein
MATTYDDIPTLKRWQKDSSVTFAIRQKDVLLRGIDTVVQAHERAKNDTLKQNYILCELFFRIDYWLRQLDAGNPVLKKGREPAVHALYTCVAEKLCTIFNVTVNVLPRELEQHFGRGLSAHGARLDHDLGCAAYLSRAEAKKYRLYWSQGKAYQFPWWNPPKGKRPSLGSLVLAESHHAQDSNIFGLDEWGGFAMSMGRDIYMAKHHCTKGHLRFGNFYHSSYLGGEAVLCAGTMLIRRGIVHGICTDSGHYRPTDRHMLNVLHTLTMVGAPLNKVKVYRHDGSLIATARQFKAADGNWNALRSRKDENVAQGLDRRRQHAEDVRLSRILKRFQGRDAAVKFIVREYGCSEQEAREMITKALERKALAPRARAALATRGFAPR